MFFAIIVKHIKKSVNVVSANFIGKLDLIAFEFIYT